MPSAEMSTNNSPRAKTALAIARKEVGAEYRQIHWEPSGADLSAINSSSSDVVLLEGIECWLPNAILQALHQIMRILVPGGLLRVQTPDLDSIIDDYFLDGQGLSTPSRGSRINARFHSTGSRFIFNEEDLAGKLIDVGFVDIRRFAAGTGSDPLFWGTPADKLLLVLEARKPRPDLEE